MASIGRVRGRAADARLLVEGAAEVRESLEAARRLIENIRAVYVGIPERRLGVSEV